MVVKTCTLQGPPDMVSAEERLQAELVFLNFRKSVTPYQLCKHILEHSKQPYVQFEAARTIKESVVREWSMLEPSDIQSLRTFLLQFVMHNSGLQGFVREQLLQAVAMIFKRGTVESNDKDMTTLFKDVEGLIQTGELSLQLLACSILTALLNEYSSGTHSSSVGLTWEFHTQCKINFETTDLKKVFSFCVQLLGELEKAASPFSRDVTAVVNRILAITAHILTWEFLPKNIPRRLIGNFSSNKEVSFQPPIEWRDMVLDGQLLQLIFRIHRKVRYNSEMAHHSLQCLSQMASLNGRIFTGDKSKVTYLGQYMQALLELTSSPLQDYEVLGLANILYNLGTFFPMPVFLGLPQEVLTSFIHNLTQLTCDFGRAAAEEEVTLPDETVFQEAYERVLDLWWNIITNPRAGLEGTVKQSALTIFNSYLQCHIAPPDGTRRQTDKGYVAEEEDDVDEDEQDDRERYRDQLNCIGAFAREVPEHTIPLLIRLLEERVHRLHSQIQRIRQSQVASPGQFATGAIQASTELLTALNEDLHWLVLIIANVLTEDQEGETPMIPQKVMQYSINSSEATNVQTTLKVLSSPSQATSAIPGGDSATDPVVRLISSVLRLCEVEKRVAESQFTSLLSPQLAASVMWCLKRWAAAYHLPNEAYYQQVSVALTAAFGEDSGSGHWTTSFMLDKIISNLALWSAEKDLLTDTLELLISMVDKTPKCNAAVKCESLWSLARAFCNNQPPVDGLPSSCKRLLCKALVAAGTGSLDKSKQEEYLRLVLQSLQERMQRLLNLADFKRNMHLPEVLSQVELLLECLSGVAEATSCVNVQILFDFLHPMLVQTVNLLDVYHNYEEVVQLVLDLFNTVANKQVCYLGGSDTAKLYECSLYMIQVYSKCNIGHRHLSKDAEEDKFADILTLMEMLTNLLSKDFIDFGPSDDKNPEPNITAADVVLLGLNTIIPLMTAELLQFPVLCTVYIRMITYVAEIYPAKISNLPPELFKGLLTSVEYGLSAFGTDVTKMSLECLASLASYVQQTKQQGTQTDQAAKHFLKLVFNLLLVESFDMDLLDTASNTFFNLICCHKDYYKELVTSLLNQQTNELYHSRLTQAFSDLTPPDLSLTLTRANRIAFTQNFDNFLVNFRGILCVK